MEIRPVRPTDLPGVELLILATLTEEYPPSLYPDLLSLWPDLFFVAADGVEIVGAVAGTRHPELPQARILILGVEPRMRRRGIGRGLVETFLQRCRQEGLQAVSLEVRASNQEALRLYGRLGFLPEARLPTFYTNGEEAVRLVCRLPT